MLTGISATIHRGYTKDDHLIDSADESAATSAVAGVEFRRAKDALAAADRAFVSACDRRVRLARVSVELRNAFGDVVSVG